MIKFIFIFFVVQLIISCGTQYVSNQEYIEVADGRKALLMTDNNSFLDSVFGTDREYVKIISIDGEAVIKRGKGNIDQHVTVLPGKRSIDYVCSIISDDSEKSFPGNIKYDFRGGFKYSLFANYHIGLFNSDCKVIIIVEFSKLKINGLEI